jgi:hypothetical protein
MHRIAMSAPPLGCARARRRHRFRGAAVGASKVLLPRDLCCKSFLLVLESCSASHSVRLACPDMQTLLLQQRAYGSVMKPNSSLWALIVESPDEPIHK